MHTQPPRRSSYGGNTWGWGARQGQLNRAMCDMACGCGHPGWFACAHFVHGCGSLCCGDVWPLVIQLSLARFIVFAAPSGRVQYKTVLRVGCGLHGLTVHSLWPERLDGSHGVPDAGLKPFMLTIRCSYEPLSLKI